jgi:tRNA G18 (ribose-2'-O)-methylase SpoU
MRRVRRWSFKIPYWNLEEWNDHQMVATRFVPEPALARSVQRRRCDIFVASAPHKAKAPSERHIPDYIAPTELASFYKIRFYNDVRLWRLIFSFAIESRRANIPGMILVQKISSLDLPELQPYATMRRPLEHESEGIFVAEGTKVVQRLLESTFTVVSVVLPEKWLEDFRPLLEARPEAIIVYLADKKLLETLTGFSMFQGVLAVGKIPPPVSLDNILSKNKKPLLCVAVDGLTNAENLGALVRNCVAFNVQALIVGETSSSPFLRRAVRNSMGTIFQLPVVELAKLGLRHKFTTKPHVTGQTLKECLKELRQHGVRCIAAHPHTNRTFLSQADFSGDCCLVFGSEGEGITPVVLEACDEAVAIPMPPTVDSLNVGAAAAVFLYEVARQRSRV